MTLCSDCPPVGYPTNKTRCKECPRIATPTVEEMISELKAAGWVAITSTTWKAPQIRGGPAGFFLGPFGAWKAMKRHEAEGGACG